MTSAVLKELVVPYVAEVDRTPTMLKVLAWSERLVEIIHHLLEKEAHLKDEVAVL
ncbi:Transposase IS66 family [Mycoavidus cysteinexigens]|uniref:Transposase IS66 family n=1 Tax=Mycoavidus cysteinexigens TaxID=1553431 RepID=A0A2Z6ET42_9BURK|nr:hypothetical protein [Mycoavidus cysteinexigens]BBE08548.1 Transposase IS66 family [Mycoavidus cysteinexigens]GAM52745.1 hypothetical protein EBME_1208 [bacterium endosymbiont of Mortierella elongata FMR23-6]GLR01015.1 hypothetical protein GCM10007934_08270 [Mycoavidus cysteinexigens]